ncbi:MAG: helix-turn-helix domain-containing protein [Patescibacteria group bacterium]
MKRSVTPAKKITLDKSASLFLKELGLTDNQIVIYGTLLSGGVFSVLQLSTITGVNRQQLYTECDRLIHRGLIQPTGKNSSRFIAAHPNTLRDLVEAERVRVDEISRGLTLTIESLLQLPRVSSRLMSIKYYYGLDQIRDAYDRELEESGKSDLISLVGSLYNPNFVHISKHYWDTWGKAFERKKKSGRLLFGTKAQVGYIAATVTARINTKLSFEPNIDVWGNTILIVSYREQMAMCLESESLAQMFRVLFDFVWEKSEEL